MQKTYGIKDSYPKYIYKKTLKGNYLLLQGLALHASIAECMDSIPGWGTVIPQALQHSQKNLKVKVKNLLKLNNKKATQFKGGKDQNRHLTNKHK